MSHGTLGVIIRDNQSTPVFVADLTQVVEQLRLSRQLPGGELESSFRVRQPTQFVPNWAGPNYDVRVLDGQGHVWRGRMERVWAVETENAEYWAISAVGYGANLDDRIDLTENVSGLATNTIVTNALTNHTQQIDVQTVSATGVTLSGATAITLTNKRVKDHLNFAAKFGFSDDLPAHWYVKTQQDGDRELVFEKRPTTAAYYIYSKDWVSARRGFDFRNYANRVIVEYNAGASVTAQTDVEDTDAQAAGPGGVGVIRTAFMTISEITQSADAIQAGQVLLTKLKTLRMNVDSVMLRPNAIILDSDGLEVAPWNVQVGKIMQIIDVHSGATTLSSLAWNNSFLIVGMEWDDDAQTLTLTPESFDNDISTIIAKAQQGLV